MADPTMAGAVDVKIGGLDGRFSTMEEWLEETNKKIKNNTNELGKMNVKIRGEIAYL